MTTYYFEVRSFNALGISPYSNVASAATTNQVAVLDLSGGFAKHHWQLYALILPLAVLAATIAAESIRPSGGGRTPS